MKPADWGSEGVAPELISFLNLNRNRTFTVGAAGWWVTACHQVQYAGGDCGDCP